MIYGYIRVSSDKQTVENQRFEINNFCQREQLQIDGWIEETISGTKNYNKRQLGKLLNRVQKDDLINRVQKDDLIICAELSRLGRNLFKAQDRMKAEKNRSSQNNSNSKAQQEQDRRNDLEKAKQERIANEQQNSKQSTPSTTNTGKKPKYTPKGNNQSSADNDDINYSKPKKPVW